MPISEEEGRKIEQLVQSMGKKWADIARQMPGRSDNAVKNWWNGGVNRRKRQGRGASDESRPPRENSIMERHDLPQHAFSMPPQHPGHHHFDPYPRPFSGMPLGSSFPIDTNVGHGFGPRFSDPAQFQSPFDRPHEPLQHHRGFMNSAPYPTRPDFAPHGYQARFEAPLPSPSGLSVMSADGAAPPSLISDNSSRRSSRYDMMSLGVPAYHNDRRSSWMGDAQGPISFGEQGQKSPTRRLPDLPPLRAAPSGPYFNTPMYRPVGEMTPSVPSQFNTRYPDPSLPSPGMMDQRRLPSFNSLGQQGMMSDMSGDSSSPMDRPESSGHHPSSFTSDHTLGSNSPVSPGSKSSRISVEGLLRS